MFRFSYHIETRNEIGKPRAQRLCVYDLSTIASYDDTQQFDSSGVGNQIPASSVIQR
jgi:hypothetical protein